MDSLLIDVALGGNFVASSITDYFLQSNFAGQVIVVILMLFSVVAWGVMFCKYIDLTTIEDLNTKARRKISQSASLAEALSETKSSQSPFAKLLKEAMTTIGHMDVASRANSAMRTAMVENALLRAMSRETAKYEQKMTLLGTIISGAPFMGLLGTVWGVMDCFGSMSHQTSVTLQQLAPGVAGSLLTTVAGLVVAIPSVFGFNFLTTQIRKMGVEIENFATSLSDRIEIEFAAKYHATPERRREIKPEKAAVDNRQFWADDGSVGKQATSANAFNAGAPAAATASDPGDKILDFSLDDDSEEISNFDEE